MYYVTDRSHRIQKHKFDVSCPSTLSWYPHRALSSMKIVRQFIMLQTPHNAQRDPQIPPDEKKNKFSLTCPGVLIVVSTLGPPEHENSASTFCTMDALELTT
jgi:hypothetical protein